MTRLAMAVLLGQSGLAQAAGGAVQSQVPMRVGDCVKSTTELEFFYKDEGEYERTTKIEVGQHGVLLNIDSNWNEPSTVEFLDKRTREPVVAGSAFFHQFARVPWEQGNVKETNHGENHDISQDLCMTVTDSEEGYQPVIRMTFCQNSDPNDEKEKWNQQFSYSPHECGPRPIRWTNDPSKCVDAVHPNKVLLTDCSGVDSQKFVFRCDGPSTPKGQADHNCNILAMGGRKDMCLWWNKDLIDANHREADLQLRSCNFADTANKKFAQQNIKLWD